MKNNAGPRAKPTTKMEKMMKVGMRKSYYAFVGDGDRLHRHSKGRLMKGGNAAFLQQRLRPDFAVQFEDDPVISGVHPRSQQGQPGCDETRDRFFGLVVVIIFCGARGGRDGRPTGRHASSSSSSSSSSSASSLRRRPIAAIQIIFLVANTLQNQRGNGAAVALW